MVHIRITLLLPLDDRFLITQDHINPKASRSGGLRCLQRYGASRLQDIIPVIEVEQPQKTFEDYKPDYIHFDIKHLPQMSDEEYRRYLFVAIVRLTAVFR